MFISSWLRPRASRLDSSSPTPSRKKATARLELEPLEDRQLLSGGLDPAFAAAGQRTIPLPDSTATETAAAVAVQKDAKIVLAGLTQDANTSEFTVVRLNADGTLDTTFGSGGRVLFQFSGATDEQVGSLTIDRATEKILVAGTVTKTSGQTTDTAFAVARLNPDGSFDTSFNGNGMEAVEVGGQSTVQGQTTAAVSLSTVAVQNTGKILLSGSVYVSSIVQGANTEQLVVARLNDNGSADASFGTSGVATVSVNAAASRAAGSVGALALPGDGTMVIAGTSGAAAGQSPANYFAVARLTAAGQLDTTFGNGGLSVFGFGNNPNSQATSVAALANGEVVVGGSTQADFALDGNSDFALARLLPNGQLDTSFNTTGAQTLGFDLGGTKSDRITALALQNDAKIVAVGTAVTATLSDTTAGVVTSSHFALARFNQDGTPDSSFNSGGTMDFGFAIGGLKSDRAAAVALESNGKIVLAGGASLSSGLPEVDAMAVARVLGSSEVASGIGGFDPNTATWYLRNLASAGAPSLSPFAYGGKGWIPVVGDWSGDGQKTIGVFDPSTATWYLKNDNNPGQPSITPFQYGAPGWIPVVGDWNGDGIDTIGVVDPKTETWYLRNENSPGAPDYLPFQYGAPGWIPVAGDWNGHGASTVGVIDPKTMTWYLRNQVSAGAPDFTPFVFGTPGSKPVVGDWNGDGTTKVGYVSGGTWYVRNSNSAGPADIRFDFGAAGWVPVAGAWAMPQFPLTAVGGEKANPATATVSATDLSNLVTAALQRLSAAGADPTVVAQLATVKVVFAQLAPGQLAYVDAAHNQIVLDSTAAGYGWFVDQTPAQDEEFVNGTTAGVSSAPFGHMDLLSAVVIEMGQTAGLDLVSPSLRNQTLAAGQRKVNAVLDVFSTMNASPTEAHQGTAQTGGQQPMTTGLPTVTADPKLPVAGLPVATRSSTTTPTSATAGSAAPVSNTATGLIFGTTASNMLSSVQGISTPLSTTSSTSAGFPTPLSSTFSTGLGVATPISSTLSTTSNQISTGVGAATSSSPFRTNLFGF
jgi:uncharacterized delta-60 repeat protein